MKRREWLCRAATIATSWNLAMNAQANAARLDPLDEPDVPDGPDDDFSPMPPAYPRVAPSRTIRGNKGRVRAVAISLDGSRIVSAEEGQNVFRIWDAGRGFEQATSQLHPGPIVALAWSPSGDQVVSASGPSKDPAIASSTVRISNASSGRFVREFDNVPGSILGVALTQGNLAFALGSADIFYSWKTDKRPVVFAPDVPADRSKGVYFGQAQSGFGVDLKGHRAVSLNTGVKIDKFVSRDHLLSLWDFETGTRRFLDAKAGPLRCVAISPDGNSIMVGSADQQILSFDFETGRRIFQFWHGPMIGGDGPNFVCYNSDGTRFVVAKKDGVIRRYESKKGTPADFARGPKAFVRAVAFMNDRLRVVSGGMAEARFKGIVRPGEPKVFEPLWVWDLLYAKNPPGVGDSFVRPGR